MYRWLGRGFAHICFVVALVAATMPAIKRKVVENDNEVVAAASKLIGIRALAESGRPGGVVFNLAKSTLNTHMLKDCSVYLSRGPGIGSPINYPPPF
jgi:hypothetical protein